MAEIPDRVPGGVILASYANDIRDRSAQRYADPTARDASNPLPAAGELAYVASLGVLQVFDGTLWRDLLDDVDLSALDARISLLELIKDSHASAFTEGSTTLGTSLGAITSQVIVPSDGTYEMELMASLTVTTAGQTTLGGVLISLEVAGVQVEAFSQYAVRHDDAGEVNAQLEVPVFLRWEQALVAGQSVQWLAFRQDLFTVSAEVTDRRNTIRRIS